MGIAKALQSVPLLLADSTLASPYCGSSSPLFPSLSCQSCLTTWASLSLSCQVFRHPRLAQFFLARWAAFWPFFVGLARPTFGMALPVVWAFNFLARGCGSLSSADSSTVTDYSLVTDSEESSGWNNSDLQISELSLPSCHG
ncbi:hypothetical protein V8E52_009589 [Russula decolorans]|jgi:hypothetical protein